MTQTQYTPGPWYADGRDIMAAPDDCVGSVTTRSTPEITTANACLIAAAPALLAALEALLRISDDVMGSLERQAAYRTARAAIAQAKGEA